MSEHIISRNGVNDIAVVLPVYNCSPVLRELCDRLVATLSGMTNDFRIVLVDDCSPDDAWSVIRELGDKDSRICGLRLSRNFGQHYALTAGLDHCRARLYVVMDADLQDAPEDIPALVAKAGEGHDVVVGVQTKEGHGFLKRMVSKLFHRVFRILSGMNSNWDEGNFRVFSEPVAHGFRRIREQLRSLSSTLNWMGFPVARVPVGHSRRAEGKSSYTFKRLMRLAMETILAHSQMPLRIVAMFGLVISLLALLAGAFVAIRTFVYGAAVSGWASLVVSVFVIGGIQIFMTGIVGIYVGKAFNEAKNDHFIWFATTAIFPIRIPLLSAARDMKTGDRIQFNVPYLTGRELDYIGDIFATRLFGGNGPYTRKCQELLKDRYDVPCVFLTHSCTGALEMAAIGLELEPGDEVILPSYTLCATATAFLRVGIRLVFCEVDPRTMMMDPEDVAARVTERTRAIVPVHYAGVAADMRRLIEIAARYNLEIVEDAAQGLESYLDGKPLGTFGRFGCLSFHETKNVHAGLGGAVFVNRPGDIERLTCIWERGTDRRRMKDGVVDKYTWVDVGSSFYPTEIQAGFLLAQLEAIAENLVERQAIREAYDAGLAPLVAAGHLAVGEVYPHRTVNCHAVFVVLNSREERETVQTSLAESGVQSVTHYEPLHASLMGSRLGYKPEDLPVTLDRAARLLRLPMHNDLSVDDVRTVCAALSACF